MSPLKLQLTNIIHKKDGDDENHIDTSVWSKRREKDDQGEAKQKNK